MESCLCRRIHFISLLVENGIRSRASKSFHQISLQKSQFSLLRFKKPSLPSRRSDICPTKTTNQTAFTNNPSPPLSYTIVSTNHHNSNKKEDKYLALAILLGLHHVSSSGLPSSSNPHSPHPYSHSPPLSDSPSSTICWYRSVLKSSSAHVLLLSVVVLDDGRITYSRYCIILILQHPSSS